MLMGTSGSAGWPVGHDRQDRIVTLRADAGGAPGVGGVVVVVSGLLLVVAGGVALRDPLRVRRGVDPHVRFADPDLGHLRSSLSSAARLTGAAARRRTRRSPATPGRPPRAPSTPAGSGPPAGSSRRPARSSARAHLGRC